MPKKDGESFFIEHSERLKEICQRIKDIDPTIYNSYSSHTVMKLFVIERWSNVFTRILSSKHIPTIYFEICSGSGLTIAEDVNKPLPGSTIVAEASSAQPYDMMFCVEQNPEYAKALKHRLTAIRDSSSFEIYPNRIEDCIDTVIQRVQSIQNGISFIFYDPEGFSGFSHKILSKICEIPGDILITWDEDGIFRNLTDAKRGIEGNVTFMNRVFGDNSWNKASTAVELTNLLRIQLEKSGRNIIRELEVKDDHGNVKYKLILAIRSTRGGSPFIRAFEELVDRLNCSEAYAKAFWISLVWGDSQSTLSNFL